MKKLSILLSIVFLISCTKEVEVDNPALQTRIDQWEDQISDLNTQLTAANNQLSTANSQNTQYQSQISQLQSDLAEAEADLAEAEADLAEAEGDLSSALADLAEAESSVEAVAAQLAELNDTILFWFGNVNSDFEFDVYSNGVFAGSYAWEIGLSDDGNPVFNSYAWSSVGCYYEIEGAGFDDAESYIDNVSVSQFGIVSYGVDGAAYNVEGDVEVSQFFSYSSAGLIALIQVYDEDDVLVYTLQTTTPLQGSTIPASDFCS